jgi:RNA polymerase-binding protein DksA
MQADGRSGGGKRSLAERFGRGRKTSAPAAGASSGPGATSPGKRTPAKKAAARKHARRLVVREDEAPWTPKELQEVRGELQADAKRLQSEIAEADKDVRTLMRDNGDGAGNDQADVGSNTFERDHEMAIVAQHREMLEQVERALSRIHDGSYGICERCGNPIGKMRLMAFPRATLCVPCKQREERR